MRKILAVLLRGLSGAVLNKYRPKVIAITGSIGKTSVKEAVFQVLKNKFSVRVTQGNYNTEIGVPLTILGSETGGRNVFKWLAIFAKGLNLLLLPNRYPEVLVLEMGADRPGDLEYLTSFVPPDISIVTTVGISHLEKFGSREAIWREKGTLVRNLKQDGVAILNWDDQGSRSLISEAKGRVLTYGLTEGADFKAENIRLEEDKELNLISTVYSLKSKFGDNTVILEKAWGEPMIQASLAALVTGYLLGLTLKEGANALRGFESAPGRLKLVKGIGDSKIIDDTYNAAPDSMIAALKLLNEFPAQRRIAILGKMAELGSESQAGHKHVGDIVAQINPDLLWVKNNEAKIIGEEALLAGYEPDRLHKFSEINEINFVPQAGDVILVKGSRSEQMEKIVEKIAQK